MVDNASPEEARAVASAALTVVWADLVWVDIDLTALLDLPATADAAGALRAHCVPKRFGRGPSENVRLHPGRHDDALPAARALVGRTIGSSGYADRDGLIFQANDEGTSCRFELTHKQVHEVTELLGQGGHTRTLLVRPRR